ncbi:solute carrier family 50 (sugar transporter) [Angomonas deanei]|uniref:Sugar efflux transporter for intercellular exchange, putative n=1 Tax=Angomonas deanei TaxID=59799 RepID=S9V928_9TRYP|nr:solute carrier family 50 (sugar transporter) [Angomonas deanei]EPY39527.1 solute carrier family 50 (sugar transporter) [Angomonas deanei]CAD2219036.1 Sugar efflux transporter for intercellular exchange, putative [Angomonas deanei]|eukprot:EPY35341.1 solute carrier family 50 (sugar transporter) [Angomonas deanei]
MSFLDIIVTVLSYAASLFSLLLNASPLITSREYEKNASIGSNNNIFLGALLFSATTWASYGLFSSTYPLLFSNMVGNAIGTYCSLVFLSVARREEKSGRVLQATTYTRSLLTYVFFETICVLHLVICIGLILVGKGNVAITITGLEATFAGVFMVSSPLLQVKTIVQAKNAQCLAPATVCFAFFNALFWVIVGVIKLDVVLFFPNFLGFLACCGQVFLIFKYGRKPVEKEEIAVAIAPVPFN